MSGLTGSTVQDYINYGYAKAASFIGETYSQYRPQGSGIVVTPANYLGTISAYVDPMVNFPANNPRQYGKALLKAVIDPMAIRPGDYLVGANRTYFVSSIQPLQPVLVVYTNDVVSVERSETPQTVGTLPYGGERKSTFVAILTSWPASVLLKGKKSKNPTGLGSDTPQTGMEILLPPGTPAILPDDIILTQTGGKRYVAENVELSDLGFRIRATEVIT